MKIWITIWTMGTAPIRRFWLDEEEITDWNPAPPDYGYQENTLYAQRFVTPGVQHSAGWQAEGSGGVHTCLFVILNTAGQRRWSSAPGSTPQERPAADKMEGADLFLP